MCRLIWNKYRKYKMRTYINTLHQTFRYVYTPKSISLINLLLLRSDMRTLICALAAFSMKVWCRNVKSMKDHGASLQWPTPPRALRQTSAKFQVKINF